MPCPGAQLPRCDLPRFENFIYITMATLSLTAATAYDLQCYFYHQNTAYKNAVIIKTA